MAKDPPNLLSHAAWARPKQSFFEFFSPRMVVSLGKLVSCHCQGSMLALKKSNRLQFMRPGRLDMPCNIIHESQRQWLTNQPQMLLRFEIFCREALKLKWCW